MLAESVGLLWLRYPINGTAGCCGSPTSGAARMQRATVAASAARMIMPPCTGGVHDAMKVVADLRERMFRRFPLYVPELVDATTLHGRPRPRFAHSAA